MTTINEFSSEIEIIKTERKFKLERISIGTTLKDYVNRLTSFGVVFDANTWLCGGAIRRACCGHNIEDGDFDIYLHRTPENQDKIAKLGSAKWSCKNSSEKNGILTYNFSIDSLDVQFHFVKQDNLADVLKSFDFTCCQFGYDGTSGWEIPGAMADAKAMKLCYSGISSNFTLARAFRFMEMGFKPSKGFLRSMQALSLNMNEPTVLKGKGRS